MTLFEQSLESVVRQIRNRELSAESVMEQVYARIERHDPELRVFRSHLPRETAVARAREVDQKTASGVETGPLAGIPVTIKDNICITDPELFTTCGSRILEEYRSPYEATVIKRLREAGALIIGTTNMDEFAMGSSTENSAHGPTLNPWDRTRVPGGSSGGAAVSVAVGMSLLALGSDTGGSVRQPASMCGVTGLKPTYGSVSRYGLVAYGSSLDQIGCLTRSAEDCRLAYRVIQGHDPQDSTSSPTVPEETPDKLNISGMRFCIPTEYLEADSVEGEVIESVQETAALLAEQGAVVEQRSLGFLKYVIPTYYILAFAEASSNLGRFDGIRYGVRKLEEASLKSLYSTSRKQGFSAEVKRRIMLGTFVLSTGYYDQYYGRAKRVRAQMEKEIGILFKEFDFVLGPVSPFPAFPIGEKIADPLAMYLADLCSVLANLTRTPAISIPGRPTRNGLPVGIQLMGNRFEDLRLLATAEIIQQQMRYYSRMPDMI